jgi:leucyl aminopeptidase
VETLRLSEPDGRYRREATEGARRGQIFAEATWFARDLINAPANDVHPTHLAEVAPSIAKAAGSSCRCSSATTARSSAWARFSAWPPAASSRPSSSPVVDAVRRSARRSRSSARASPFDSGGLDLKSAEGMLRMKDDMSGAAAVLGSCARCPRSSRPVEVHGLIAATENMPSGAAIRPGDVLGR